MSNHRLPAAHHVESHNPLTEDFLRCALQDRTLFAATLTFSSFHLDILNRGQRSTDILWRISESIKACEVIVIKRCDLTFNRWRCRYAVIGRSKPGELRQTCFVKKSREADIVDLSV